VAKFLGQSNVFVGEVTETSGDSVSINFKGNKLTAPLSRVEKSSGKIALGVRPEKTRFHESKPDHDPSVNVLGPGEITDIRFTGVSNQYLIEIPEIGEVVVFAQNIGKSPVIALGAQVWVSWKVEHGFGLADLPTGKEDA
jgi:spermidine/putrescine transport system ATP-binding protein